MISQNKLVSFIEATTNAVVGLIISWVFTYWGLPLFDIHPSLPQAAGITACYFFLSIGRAYVLRRGFESMWLRKIRIEIKLWKLKKDVTAFQKKI
jgi:hypothetical protein|tara:strand:- start:451 stop:735 length:285 start_codon:yes stop_codon:yes gene_type:complete